MVSLCIGLVALLVVNGARLAFRRDQAQRRRRRIPVFVLLITAAPCAHYVSLCIGSAILGFDAPDLAHY